VPNVTKNKAIPIGIATTSVSEGERAEPFLLAGVEEEIDSEIEELFPAFVVIVESVDRVAVEVLEVVEVMEEELVLVKVLLEVNELVEPEELDEVGGFRWWRAIQKDKLSFLSLARKVRILQPSIDRRARWTALGGPVPQNLSTLPFFIAAMSTRPIAATKMAGPPNCGTVDGGGSPNATKASLALKVGWTPPIVTLVIPAHTAVYVPAVAVLGAPVPAVKSVG